MKRQEEAEKKAKRLEERLEKKKQRKRCKNAERAQKKAEREAAKAEREAAKVRTKTAVKTRGKAKRKADEGESSCSKKAKLDTAVQSDTCCVCFGSYEEDAGTDREWLQCKCSRWIHEDCVDYDETLVVTYGKPKWTKIRTDYQMDYPCTNQLLNRFSLQLNGLPRH